MLSIKIINYSVRLCSICTCADIHILKLSFKVLIDCYWNIGIASLEYSVSVYGSFIECGRDNLGTMSGQCRDNYFLLLGETYSFG